MEKILPNGCLSPELSHHGILGMKWGIRRFQPYPKGYSGDGKEVGEAKRKSKDVRRENKTKQKQWKKDLTTIAIVTDGLRKNLDKMSKEADKALKSYNKFNNYKDDNGKNLFKRSTKVLGENFDSKSSDLKKEIKRVAKLAAEDPRAKKLGSSKDDIIDAIEYGLHQVYESRESKFPIFYLTDRSYTPGLQEHMMAVQQQMHSMQISNLIHNQNVMLMNQHINDLNLHNHMMSTMDMHFLF